MSLLRMTKMINNSVKRKIDDYLDKDSLKDVELFGGGVVSNVFKHGVKSIFA